MKRLVLGLAVLTAAGPASSAHGQVSPASPQASCVAVITSFEASQLEPGAVGREVSGLAASGPGLGRELVSGLAKQHAGSVEQCLEAEG